MDFVIARQISQ